MVMFPYCLIFNDVREQVIDKYGENVITVQNLRGVLCKHYDIDRNSEKIINSKTPT